MNPRVNVGIPQLLRETHNAAALKKILTAWAGKLLITACCPCPSLRRFFARAGVTPAHFGNRAVRLPIPDHSKSVMMAGAGKNHLAHQLFWSGTNYYEPFTRTVIE